jgi:hypothetical protein
MYTSGAPFVSTAGSNASFVTKTTLVPSPLISGLKESPPWLPSTFRLARTVVPASRSRTKTSGTPLLSPDTRFVAPESNATRRPSALIVTAPLGADTNWPESVTPSWTESALAPAPAGPSARDTSVVSLVSVSRTNTFTYRLSSASDRSSSCDAKAT